MIKPSEPSSDHLCPCRTSTASGFAVVTWKNPINYLVLLFPHKVHGNRWPARPSVTAATSPPPVCCTEACSLFLLSPKPPALHPSCTWRFQTTGPGWREGPTSLLGLGGLPCKAALSCFEAIAGARQRTSIFAESSPLPLARRRSHMFSRLSLCVGDETHCHTGSLLGSCGMSNPILWNGFSSSSFYSAPSLLRLVS